MVAQVLVVDPERKRISLTAKKTLVESSLPIISQFSDAQVGVLTHAVVFKVSDKSLQVEFYNNLKAIVPAREARCVLQKPRSSLHLSFPFIVRPPLHHCQLHSPLESLYRSASLRSTRRHPA